MVRPATDANPPSSARVLLKSVSKAYLTRKSRTAYTHDGRTVFTDVAVIQTQQPKGDPPQPDTHPLRRLSKNA